MIPKLNAYDFTLPALQSISNDLANGKQRTKINQSLSSWEDMMLRVPQRCILNKLNFLTTSKS